MRRTAGPDGWAAREPGQGLTAAAISFVVRAVGRLVVLPIASFVMTPKAKTKNRTSESDVQADAPNAVENSAIDPAASHSASPKSDLFGAEVAAAPYQVFARRYRSRSFEEVVGQDAIANTLRNAISLGRTAHAYLFCGTRGVGKTSMARIFARALNAVDSLTQQAAIGESIMRGQDLDVVEIDGASNRGVDDARDLIAGAGMAPARSPYKIYIIDEVHMLTQPAFNALLKTMEEPPAHVKFILCTTEPHKVPATIQSRCQRFDFRSIPTVAIAAHLRSVLTSEKLTADEAVILQVARLANGSMRDGLSLLDRLVSAASGHVSVALARDVLGLPDEELLEALLSAIADGDPGRGLATAATLLDQGMSCDHALDTIASRLRDALLLRVCGPQSELVDLPAETRSRMAVHAGKFDPPALVHLIALCDASVRNIRGSAVPRALFDAVIARLCMSEHFTSGAALLASEGAASDSKKKIIEMPRATAAAPILTAAKPIAAPQFVSASKAFSPPTPTSTSTPSQQTKPQDDFTSKSVTPRTDPNLEAVRRHPLVREAAEILDAAISRVTPRTVASTNTAADSTAPINGNL